MWVQNCHQLCSSVYGYKLCVRELSSILEFCLRHGGLMFANYVVDAKHARPFCRIK